MRHNRKATDATTLKTTAPSGSNHVFITAKDTCAYVHIKAGLDK